MMTSELPQELLEEILCRVPATALKRLRTTCKQWNHVFNDKKFTRKHFDKAPKQCLALTLTEEFRVCLLNVNLHNGIPLAEVASELSGLNQVYIDQVSHCDGLLLCTTKGDDDTRLILWNPCNGQIKWIQTPSKKSYLDQYDFVLGYCQENKSCDKSYKILGYQYFEEPELYDINSNSWRSVTPIPNYFYTFNGFDSNNVSLKGKTYLFSWEDKDGLISFDYTRERFERLLLPHDRCYKYKNLYLSVVGEDKLSVLLEYASSMEEIWVTNKINDETKELSWSMLLELKDKPRFDDYPYTRFLVDEEKKIVVCCDRISQSVITVYTVGEEDSNATLTSFPVKKMCSYVPFLVCYVPSLIQFQEDVFIGKIKRGE